MPGYAGPQERCYPALFPPPWRPGEPMPKIPHWECCIVPLADPSGSTMRFLVVLRDVTELKNSMNRIRALTGELLQAQERERHMIAGELHDGVAQDLAAHKMTCLGMMAQWEDLPREVTNRISKMAGDLEKNHPWCAGFGLRSPASRS